MRCCTARGAGSGLSLGGPTKVNARKSYLFTYRKDTEPLLKFAISVSKQYNSVLCFFAFSFIWSSFGSSSFLFFHSSGFGLLDQLDCVFIQIDE